MQSRNQAPHYRNEPKVIAIAAVRPTISQALFWASGTALLAYTACLLLLH